jgi:hypothetical protein
MLRGSVFATEIIGIKEWMNAAMLSEGLPHGSMRASLKKYWIMPGKANWGGLPVEGNETGRARISESLFDHRRDGQ